MKKLITIGLLSLMLAMVVATPTLALTAGETGLTYGEQLGLGTQDLRDTIMGIISVLLGFLGIIAIVIILWGGFVWMTAGGNEEKVGEAKKIITAGIIGLVIIFTAYAIAQFVITSLLEATTGETQVEEVNTNV